MVVGAVIVGGAGLVSPAPATDADQRTLPVAARASIGADKKSSSFRSRTAERSAKDEDMMKQRLSSLSQELAFTR